MTATFDDLLAEAQAEPTEGWDFSWFEGRATEERPSWAYARSLQPRIAAALAVLDIQTGGGEVFAEALARGRTPEVVAATESWPPNLALATQRLRPFGGRVVRAGDDEPLPFPDAGFDLVVSRHPTVVLWDEISRVLRPGGTYFAQQIGPGTNRELTEFLMGPQPTSDRRSPERAAAEAARTGLEVVDIRQESLEVRFFDIGAVAYFLRKVIWTVPDFSVDRYRERLRSLHDEIVAEGAFVSHAQRLLVETRKP